MSDYWLLVRSPARERTAVHLGQVDPGDSHLVAAVRAHLEVPDGDPLATGWDLQLTDAKPHDEWLGHVVEWPTANP